MRRVELQVWEDNTRARALYASRGFVPEGVLRADGWRAGGHASSLEMALDLGEAGAPPLSG
jgi:RimJ/RimL family protein N-acetyltransferase